MSGANRHGWVTAVPLIAKLMAQAEGSNVDGNTSSASTSTRRVLAADFEIRPPRESPGVWRDTDRDNVWYHAAATYDARTWRLYLNGQLETTLVVGAFTPRFDSIQHAGSVPR